MKHSEFEFGSATGFMPNGKYDKFACIPDYDAGTPERTKGGNKVVRFHGDATYLVLGRCEYGCGYHCRLIWSRHYAKGQETKAQARQRLRTAALAYM